MAASAAVMTFDLHQLGAAFEVASTRRAAFVAAAGRHDANDTAPVAILGDVERRFGDDAVRAILARRQRRRPGLASAILPPGEALALADEDFCAPAAAVSSSSS